MFGFCSFSGRIGEVSQTKYGHSGCAFFSFSFFLFFHSDSQTRPQSVYML